MPIRFLKKVGRHLKKFEPSTDLYSLGGCVTPLHPYPAMVPQMTPIDRNALVGQFHQAFDVPEEALPRNPESIAVLKQRIKWIAEELCELAHACNMLLSVEADAMSGPNEDQITVVYLGGEPNLVEVADALTDLDYFVTGSHRVWGLPQDALFKLVHANNMSKLGPNGKPIKNAEGKVQKPATWVDPKPQIAQLLRSYGAKV